MLLVSSVVGCSRISARVSRAVISEQALDVFSNLTGERVQRERARGIAAGPLSLLTIFTIVNTLIYLYICIHIYLLSMWRLWPERCGNRCHIIYF